MARVDLNGIVTINDGKEMLLKEIKRNIKHTTVMLVGPAGTGKTALMEELAKDKELGVDELIILRIQGLSSEDFRLPILNTIVKTKEGVEIIEKEVDFAQVGVFKRIIENPDKKFLLFFDEVNRGAKDVIPLLFGLFEKKFMDGIKRENVYIAGCINVGDDYDTYIDFGDKALRRRMVLIGTDPSKEDFINFISENKYHKIIQEVAEFLPKSTILDYETSKEYMQTTNFGSWDLLNKRWNDMDSETKKGMSYDDALEDVRSFGSYFFTDKTKKELTDKLVLLISLNTIDIQKQIIDKGGIEKDSVIIDKKGNKFDTAGKEMILKIRTRYFVLEEIIKNNEYLSENCINLCKVFKGDNNLLIGLFGELKKKVTVSECNKILIDFNKKLIIETEGENGDVAKEIISQLRESYQILMGE